VVLTFMDKTRGYFERIGFSDAIINLQADPKAVANRLEFLLGNRDEATAEIRSGVIEVRRDAQTYPAILTDLVAESEDETDGWAKQILDV
jgi:hypothetical protein